MDTFALIFTIALVVFATLLIRPIRIKLRALRPKDGGRRGIAAAGRLGVSLRLGAGGLAIAERTLGEMRGVTRESATEWTLVWLEPEDLLIRWVPEGDGGVIRVVRAAEMDGIPVGDRAWQRLVAAIDRAASTQGVPVQRRDGRLHPIPARDGSGARFWMPED